MDEYTHRARLAPVPPDVPRTVVPCDDPPVLGSDRYVIVRVEARREGLVA